MKKIGLAILLSVVILGISGIAGAGLIPVADQVKEKAQVEHSLAIEETNHHWVLTPPGLEKKIFVHYPAKPPWAGGGGKEKEPACYEFLGKWVKWRDLPVSYVIDPENPQGLDEDFIANAIFAGAEEWDSWIGAELFNDSYTIVYDGSWDSDSPDGRNELVFGDYPTDGVIAVTVVWGYFSGPPSEREIIEFDVMFDTDFVWGDAISDSSVMDLQNIATHEIGHGAGLDDIYDDACSEVTMYGYSDYGEKKKRDLESPDIIGIQELYGEF